MNIRPLQDSDTDWAKALVSHHFGSEQVVSRGVIHNALSLDGLVAEADHARIGLLQYRLDHDGCEVVTLISVKPRQGIARNQLAKLEVVARARGCRKLWLVTTNNNISAIRAYRALGWREVAVHRGAVREARALKPELPEFNEKGTPIEDEIEFELVL